MLWRAIDLVVRETALHRVRLDRPPSAAA